MDLRQAIREGRVGLSPVGEVGRGADGIPPYVVNIGEVEVEPISTYLQPLLPGACSYVEADYERWSTLLKTATAATDGEQFIVADKVYTRVHSREDLRRARNGKTPTVRVRDEQNGKSIAVQRHEDSSFWGHGRSWKRCGTAAFG